MASKNLLKPSGLSAFRRFLREETPTLRKSPVLVIASESADHGVKTLKAVEDACRAVNYVLTQEMGLRIVQSSISSAFPTIHDLEQRLELIRRTGASSVVAVGSGAAIDLSKVLPHQKEIEHLMLVPSTSAAMLAASSSHSLFLDSVDEALVPFPSALGTPQTNTNIISLEPSYLASAELSHVLFATLAIVLDACYRKSSHPILLEAVRNLVEVLGNPDKDRDHATAQELLYQSGMLLSYGLGQDDRSIPIALSSSLIPTIFPHIHVLSFFASLLPGICELVDEQDHDDEAVVKLVQMVKSISPESIPQLAVNDANLDGFSVPDMSLSHIQSNQALWKSFDVPNKVLLQILERSVQK
ncbi:unnamed protein product [Cylindrotheca closterium]|uniref:Alcohol dehydrogenase iron-type/glycerol dehydrogenase GldA domain-containing protein n=1 Tax=Cylindrotheca closterium TaxID=2856 RepID=A0AAD2FJ74_9STRA|nr:unnamed protein product [Cylindrotheca closterium]